MRGLLTGVLVRVDRLAAKMQLSDEDREAKLKTMSYEDLEALMVRTLERAVGPADGFGTADAFVDAVCAATHEGRDQQSGTQDNSLDVAPPASLAEGKGQSRAAPAAMIGQFRQATCP